jgi:uridine kinase
MEKQEQQHIGFTCASLVPTHCTMLPRLESIAWVTSKAESLAYEQERPVITLIAGGSASGKTRFSKEIFIEFDQGPFTEQVVLISTDDYFIGREFSEQHGYSFDQPESVDIPLLAEHIKALKKGDSIQKPIYSFEVDGGKRIGYEEVGPAMIIIIEGLFALHPLLVDLGDFKVFVKADCHGRIIRRVARDIKRTTWEPSETLIYCLKVVEPMHRMYVDPQERLADLVVINQYDPRFESAAADCPSEEQCKIALTETPSIKMLLAAEQLSHTDQTDTYFVLPGTDEEELLRVRESRDFILFTYKAPAQEGDVRIKNKLEFPISQEDLLSLLERVKPVLQIRNSRTLYRLQGGTLFSLDRVVAPSEVGRYFLEIRSGELSEIKKVLKMLELPENSEIIKESYYDLFK